jgi:hypothetical protein
MVSSLPHPPSQALGTTFLVLFYRTGCSFSFVPLWRLEWTEQQHHSNEMWILDSTFLVFLQLFLPEGVEYAI